MKFKQLKLSLLIVIISVSSLFLVAYDNTRDFEIVKNLNIYLTLFKELNLYYVEDTDPGELIKTSIDEMLQSLDPYTTYIPESDIEDYKFMTTGQYGGVGAVINKRNEDVVIIEPYKGSPIDSAGLKAGDIILQIDGNFVKDKTTEDISTLLKGQPNTNVSLKVKRPFINKEFSVEIVRKKIQINSVPYYGILENNIGYIKLSSFTNRSSNDVKQALQKLKNSNISGLILDLRGNPGGLLTESVNIVNLFVDKGTFVVSTKGKVDQWNKKFHALFNPVDKELPLVVLVNRMSASASEIVSGAVQDLDRGIIIGQRTYGKGLVQTTRSLSYNSKLKVTTAKYYIPSGRCIQALDYAHRNPDGSVGRIPDSLISEFKTKNGRKVFDGGGVNPDIQIENPEYGNVTQNLVSKYHIFDFLTKFTTEHDSVPAPEEIDINDELFNAFIDYLEQINFKYETKREHALDQLIAAAKSEKYFEKAKDEIDRLRNKLKHNAKTDLELFRDEIEEFLIEEMAARYYYQEGRIIAGLSHDRYIDSSMVYLQDKQKYEKVLALSE